MTHTESTIIKALNGRFPRQNVEYKLSNSFVFKWESDFFLVQKGSGYSYEIEIKISKADFLKDAEKVQKHQILKDGKYQYKRSFWNAETRGFDNHTYEEKECSFRPNKFYYCVPEGLITVEQLPPYAGLMYITELGEVVTIKEAPFLHKEKLNYHNVLCPKFYNKYLDLRHAHEQLKQKTTVNNNLFK